MGVKWHNSNTLDEKQFQFMIYDSIFNLEYAFNWKLPPVESITTIYKKYWNRPIMKIKNLIVVDL
ncbi:MAG: hypothetical protein ACTSRA_10745 [Promethearchaeota archaeon]